LPDHGGLSRRREAIRWDRARFRAFYHPERGVAPAIFLGEVGTGRVQILDPRVIVFNESTATVDYSPRYNESQQADWVKDWLRLHPNWGVAGCEADWVKALRRR
jgi:hypothetical protein